MAPNRKDPWVRKFVTDYISEAQQLLQRIEVVADAPDIPLDFVGAIDQLALRIATLNADLGHTVYAIGNGGSASIASAFVCRLWKFCSVRAMSFNEPVTLTSVSNDFSFDRVFAIPLSFVCGSNDTLVAISSSGKSANIINGIAAARKKGSSCIVTLSGFDRDNPLRTLGDINFYVPSHSYRHVERTHMFVLDCLIDALIVMSNQEGA